MFPTLAESSVTVSCQEVGDVQSNLIMAYLILGAHKCVFTAGAEDA